MCSFSPVRTPKLRFAAEQPSTGECWIPPKKDTPRPKAKKPQQDGMRGEIKFAIKPHAPQRHSEGSNKTRTQRAYSSESRQNENHNHRKLTNLITWTTALSNSVKLWAMPYRATQDRQITVKSSDRTWSTGEGMANYFSILAMRTPWTVWKGKKILHWKMNFPSQ